MPPSGDRCHALTEPSRAPRSFAVAGIALWGKLHFIDRLDDLHRTFPPGRLLVPEEEVAEDERRLRLAGIAPRPRPRGRSAVRPPPSHRPDGSTNGSGAAFADGRDGRPTGLPHRPQLELSRAQPSSAEAARAHCPQLELPEALLRVPRAAYLPDKPPEAGGVEGAPKDSPGQPDQHSLPTTCAGLYGEQSSTLSASAMPAAAVHATCASIVAETDDEASDVEPLGNHEVGRFPV